MSLILDINGVLIRDVKLLDHLKRNCENYVQMKMPERPDAKYINHIMHQVYGHAGKGIAKEFKIDTSDFNDLVYDKKLTEHLWSVLSGTEFQQEAELLSRMTNDGWDISLFSNNPLVWSIPVANAICDRVKVVYNEDKLKPDLIAYTQFPEVEHTTYVDANVKNLLPAHWLLGWNTIHFEQGSIVPLYSYLCTNHSKQLRSPDRYNH